MAKFRPLYDRVLVKRLSADERTSGGLFLPETAKEKTQQAEVIAVGTGRVTKTNAIVPLTVKAGTALLPATSRPSGAPSVKGGIDNVTLAGTWYPLLMGVMSKGVTPPPTSKPVT